MAANTNPEENDPHEAVKAIIRAIEDKAAGSYQKEQILLAFLNRAFQNRWERAGLALLDAQRAAFLKSMGAGVDINNASEVRGHE